MSTYVAIINTPGHLPLDEDPPTFDTARDAWHHLWDEHAEAWDGDIPLHDSHTFANLSHLGCAGSIILATPGYTGDHDLGLAYSVIEQED